MGRSAARIAETVRRESAPVLRSGFAFGMNALGIVSESSTRTSAHKPPFIPSFGFHEVHESKPIDAAPARIIDTVATLDMRTDPIVDALLNVREFPAAVAASLRSGATRVERERFGLHAFTPLHRDETSLSLGLIGRFWRPDLGVLKIADAAAFVRHDDPRDAKLVLRFEVVARRCAPAAHRNLRALPDRTHAAAVHAVLARDPDGERLDPAPDADGCRNGAGVGPRRTCHCGTRGLPASKRLDHDQPDDDCRRGHDRARLPEPGRRRPMRTQPSGLQSFRHTRRPPQHRANRTRSMTRIRNP